nr:Zinc finger domain containing protein [Haemonchus contortus]
MLSFMVQPSFSAPLRSKDASSPFTDQFLDVFMNAQLHHFLKSLPQLEKRNHESLDEQRSHCSFSIDNLLRSESDENKTSSSPRSDVTAYTLDALETFDRRTKRERRFASSRCVCDQCGKSYATTSNLSRHKQTHRPLDSEHAKQCPHCDRVYVSMPALSMHILTHKANHKCNLCGKVFSRLWLLQGHLRSHTGQRPFGCAHCGKNFADRSNLRAHILTHNGEKKYSCKRCGRRFALRSYLNRHTETSCRIE